MQQLKDKIILHLKKKGASVELFFENQQSYTYSYLGEHIVGENVICFKSTFDSENEIVVNLNTVSFVIFSKKH
ncbi:MAG TPA: hypothetical protein H9948_08795 [Candidatus Jeotgalibaca merdavium]|uniref:Uncharacterized protein n=1 Tax=Candidatus Jeotgalibaca merdavium TaxID=2838627 RepID=A0A9D2KZ83_9LACT|nr:hypothetical protein [Candidatus Jeotgalibaca merdavium]